MVVYLVGCSQASTRCFFFEHQSQDDTALVSRNVIVSLGQNIFTPQDLTRSDLIEDDRPYAGWLYGGLGFRRRGPGIMDTLELQFGFIGEPSLGEPTQTLVHKLRGIEKPNGWRHQLKTEPTTGLTYERKWRAFDRGGRSGFGLNAIPHVGVVLGNVDIFASVGG